jgi:hypothetical protein
MVPVDSIRFSKGDGFRRFVLAGVRRPTRLLVAILEGVGSSTGDGKIGREIMFGSSVLLASTEILKT